MTAIATITPCPATTISLAPAKPAAVAAPAAAKADPHRFADAMEAALTGLVFTGALLFGAGLLHIIAPAGTARLFGLDALYGLAAFTGAMTLTAMVRAFVKTV
jgi:hypothetical protein